MGPSYRQKNTNPTNNTSSPVILNYRARSITQSSSVSSKLANQPYTSAGLRGDGQIVTIADTGLDVNSCYFFDKAGRVPPSQPNAPVFNSRLRKVIGYIYNSCGDQIDTSEGHGTHVSGTVAGYVAGSDLSAGKLHIAFETLTPYFIALHRLKLDNMLESHQMQRLYSTIFHEAGLVYAFLGRNNSTE